MVLFYSLIELDKPQRIHMVVVRETWRQLFTKCVPKVTVPAATNPCKDDNICTVSDMIIYGAVQRVQYI